MTKNFRQYQIPYFMKNLFSALFILLLLSSCGSLKKNDLKKSDLKRDVELVTSEGSIVLRLYDDTPLSRNNFLKLVKEGMYDSILFHRVIEGFMIQAGEAVDQDAAAEKRKSKGFPETIPAEITATHFHKRGALGAARMGDDVNPLRAGSEIQFYIVHGKTYTDSTLDIAETRINKMLAHNQVINSAGFKPKFEKLQEYKKTDEPAYERTISALTSELDSLTKSELETMQLFHFSEVNREIYKTVGGAAHLDQNYTVFGEVISGMEVVDKIAATETGKADRPVGNIFILSTQLVKREKEEK